MAGLVSWNTYRCPAWVTWASSYLGGWVPRATVPGAPDGNCIAFHAGEGTQIPPPPLLEGGLPLSLCKMSMGTLYVEGVFGRGLVSP